MTGHEEIDDPCGNFGTVQRYALVWFFSVIIIGGALTYKLSKIDRTMYETGAEVVETDDLRDMRRAQYSLPTDVLDDRQQTITLSTAEPDRLPRD